MAGRLVSRPDEAGYAPACDAAGLALSRPARVDEYRGFWFVAFNGDIERLVDYLDGSTEYLDLIVDQSRRGMEVIRGSVASATRANWKLVIDNSGDGYHGTILHQTFMAYLKSIGGLRDSVLEEMRPPRDLGHGHAAIETVSPEGRPVAKWDRLFGEEARGRSRRSDGVW
jgi:p-cumate 2,3-dioxygenase alpha subunit